MNHRKFIVTSTVLMVLIGGTVVGLALYMTFGVNASVPGLPDAVTYLPAESQAVFGMNVQKFVASPIFARFEETHGEEIGRDLAEFTARTGVDPRHDVSYLVAGGRALDNRQGKGVVIAIGNFDAAAITTFIQTRGTPIELDYEGARVLMIPEDDGAKIEKGIAFLSKNEIALGDLESLKAVLDVRSGNAPGALSNAVLAPLVASLDPEEMIWFAGEAASIVAKAPANTPLTESVSAVQNIVGALNLTDSVTGKITATAKDEQSAMKLADVARGLLALGQLAGDYDESVAELIQGISVSQEENKISLTVNIPWDLIEALDHKKEEIKKVI